MNNTTSEIPLLDLGRQYEALFPELEKDFSKFIRSGKFILGPEVTKLESELASYLGAAHTIGVSNGTDALTLSLRAVDVKPGDKVLTTPFTFFATASSILAVGARPVFADIEEASFCLSPEACEEVLKKDTKKEIKAVVVVHLYGHPAKMEAFQKISEKYGVPILEDAAQAIGSSYKGKKAGTFGKLASFSFYPTKNLGAMGDAGLVSTMDSEMNSKVRMLRAHGSKQTYIHDMIGGNYRIDTLQALLLLRFLPLLDSWIEKRRSLAKKYNEAFAKNASLVVAPTEDKEVFHGYHQYTIRVKDGKRDSLRSILNENKIASCIYYPVPCHKQNALAPFLTGKEVFPVAEKACTEALSLPIFPEMTVLEQKKVIDVISDWAKANA